MTALLDLQSGIGRTILDGNTRSAVIGSLAVRGADPQARLGIYRNNTFISLTEALKAIYPVVVRLVDARFFGYLAHEFIKVQPPREARLAVYGRDFAAFIARFPSCRGLPYLPDVARLEWAINQAVCSGERLPLGAGALACVPGPFVAESHIVLQRSVRFAISRWPVLDIWRTNQFDADETEAVDLTEGPQRVMICRRGGRAMLHRLSPAAFAFRRAIVRGDTIGEATRRACRRDNAFDLVSELAALFDDGLVTTIHKPDYRPYSE
jgi:hypothetical protein